MFRKIFLRQSFITAMPFLLFVFLMAAAQEARAVNIYGVTATNQLVRFDSSTPANLTTVGAITGLQGGENILGIDFRPATGQLYGLGSTSRLYVINTASGAASAVGAVLSPALSGTDFGFDFNPTVDRIRIVSNTGQNLRVNPNDGAVTVDGALNPAAAQVTAAAYTNNFNGASVTTLYDIDANTDQLFTQNPPNSGTLVAVGALGVDVQSVNGFDFTSATNTAYLVATPTVGLGNPTLFTVNLTTGAATSIGAVGGVSNFTALRGLAVVAGSATASDRLDFDGDLRADFANFRISNSTWYVRSSITGGASVFQFGLGGSDILAPGDYDGDRRADAAVFRPSNGTWYVLRSSNNQLQVQQFGQNGDQPVAARLRRRRSDGFRGRQADGRQYVLVRPEQRE